MNVEIRVVEGPEKGQSFLLGPNTRLAFGRGDESQAQLANDELLSRVHFQVEFDGQHLFLSDLGSTNGTFVDGKQIMPKSPVHLQNGQHFIAGRVSKFQVAFLAPVQPAPPAVAPPGPGVPHPQDNQSNFGSSMYHQPGNSPGQAPNPPAPPQPASSGGGMSEGVFSKSIRDGFSDQSDIFGNFGTGGNYGGLDSSGFRDGLGDQKSPGLTSNAGGNDLPPPMEMPPVSLPGNQPPAPPTTPSQPPEVSPPDSLMDDYGASIAAPGVQGVQGGSNQYSFEQLGTDSKLPPEVPPAIPNVQLPNAQSKPSTPFSSVPPTPVSGPEQAPVTNVEMATPADQPPAKPQFREPVPTPAPDEPISNFESIGAPGAMPTGVQTNQPPVMPPPTAVAENPAAQHTESISTSSHSIGLPGHYVEAPKRPTLQAETPLPVTQKTSFQVWQKENGVFFHAGSDIADLNKILKGFESQFEALFTLHLARTELELEEQPAKTKEEAAMVQPGEKASEPAADESDSPFADDSPFSDSVGPPPAAEENSNAAAPEESAPLFQRLGDPLFHWLPKEARWGGPVLVNAEEMPAELADVWGQDAVVTFLGGSFDQMAGHLKSLVRTDIRSGKPSSGMFGFCWPNVLHATLETQSSKIIDRIFDLGGITAILIEDPMAEHAWILLGKMDLSEHLFAAGFARV